LRSRFTAHTLEDKQDAWADVKKYGGLYVTEWIPRRSGGVKATLKWLPFKKRDLWSKKVNAWRDEMEERYGDD